MKTRLHKEFLKITTKHHSTEEDYVPWLSVIWSSESCPFKQIRCVNQMLIWTLISNKINNNNMNLVDVLNWVKSYGGETEKIQSLYEILKKYFKRILGNNYRFKFWNLERQERVMRGDLYSLSILKKEKMCNCNIPLTVQTKPGPTER